MNDEILLEEFFEIWVQSIRGAEDDLKNAAAALLPMIRSGSRAHVLHDLIMRRLYAAFAGREDIRIRPYKRLQVMYLPDDKGRVIFKKLTRGLRSRSYPTPQNRAYMLQQKLDDLPEPAVNYVVGYTMNRLSTGIQHCWATRPNGKRVDWYKCLDEDATQVGLPTIAPRRNATSDPKPVKGRVKPRSVPGNVIPMPGVKDGNS